MNRLIVSETDRGNYAVRPYNWAGIWNAEGKIKECGLNHIAVFHHKEDAEWYADTKNAEEQGLLLRLPCKFNETVYWIRPNVMGKPTEVMETRFDDSMISRLDLFGKVFFTSKAEAEAALEKMKGEEHE